MSSTPSSHSEGEIVTSDSEKATQTLPSRNDISVDRRTRNHPTSLRSPRSRSRSRSHSRSRYRGPRGQKRRRNGEDVDGLSESAPRSEKHRYPNDRRPLDRITRRYQDTELRPRKKSHRGYDHNLGRRHSPNRRELRSRSRSRSPFRHSHVEGKSDHGDALNPSARKDSNHSAQISRDESRHGNQLSVSEQREASGHALTLKSAAKTSENLSSQSRPGGPSINEPRKYVLLGHTSTVTDRLASIQPGMEVSGEPEVNPSPHLVNEAVLIEESRRRREARKAKYRIQDSPLLVQALHQGADGNLSAPSAAPNPSRPECPTAGVVPGPKEPSSFKAVESPILQTPIDAPPSPGEIPFDTGDIMANSDSALLAGGEEEPSAADYDPTIDMQEERARHDKRLFKEGVSVSVDEVNRALELDEGKDTAIGDSAPQIDAELLEKRQDRFDMFAEDDDDGDMFAEVAAHPTRPSTASDTKVAQSLDVKMMDNWDDVQGYYNTILGELFESRYHVLQNLGRGMFSSVVRATDTTTGRLVAIKIVRSNDTMRKAGIKEIGILKDIAANDPEDKRHMIRLERSFEHKGHLCMVFENLSLNLREVLKKFGRDVGINLKAIRAYAQQLFLGLSLLRKCQYLHADLKPDNILVNDARNVLKICDLGSASAVGESVMAPYLVSRFYRAPEIILGIPYDYGIDVWSIGCTLFELYTGKILFTGRNNNGMLRSIMECRGKLPHKVLRRGNLTHQYFDDLLNFQAIEEDQLTGRKLTKLIDIKAKPVKALRERLIPRGKKMDEKERKEVESFADLLEKCLDLRGEKRITPSDALKHPFIARAKA